MDVTKPVLINDKFYERHKVIMRGVGHQIREFYTVRGVTYVHQSINLFSKALLSSIYCRIYVGAKYYTSLLHSICQVKVRQVRHS